jgi:hypothetical protein
MKDPGIIRHETAQNDLPSMQVSEPDVSQTNTIQSKLSKIDMVIGFITSKLVGSFFLFLFLDKLFNLGVDLSLNISPYLCLSLGLPLLIGRDTMKLIRRIIQRLDASLTEGEKK